jgi:hypothetical protein
MLNLTRNKIILIGIGTLVALGYIFFSPSRSDLSCSNKYLLDQVKPHIINNMGVYYFALEGTGFLEQNAAEFDLLEKLPGIVNDIDSARGDKIEDPYSSILYTDINDINSTSSGLGDILYYCEANSQKCPLILNSTRTGFSQELVGQFQAYKNKILKSFTKVAISSIITVSIDHNIKSISCQAEFTPLFDGANAENPQLMSYQAQLDADGNWLFSSQFGS